MSKKNKSIFFSLCFVVCFSFVLVFINHEQKKYKEVQQEKIAIVLKNFNNHFKYFVEDLIANGIITSEYFSHGTINQNNYEELMKSISENFTGIYGINLLDRDGRIIRVYPYEANKLSLYRTTQNYLNLMDSYRKDERFWFSPPFHLFQGPLGFVIYLPIVRGKMLIGWIGVVVTVNHFFETLKNKLEMEDLHLVIRDNATRKNYLNTDKHINPPSDALVSHEEIRGRKITIISWPKSRLLNIKAWPFSFSLALFVSVLLTYIYILIDKRSKISMASTEIDSIILFTLREASSGAILIQHQLDVLSTVPEYISIDKMKLLAHYNATLLNQANILRRMLSEEETKNLVNIQIIPFIKEMMDQFKDKLKQKNIMISVEPGNAIGHAFLANEWLMFHSVFSPLLSHIIEQSSSESSLQLEIFVENAYVRILMKNLNTSQNLTVVEELQLERPILMAKKILHLMHGELLVKRNKTGEYFLTLHLLKGN